MNSISYSIATNLEARRRARGLSYKELARRAGVNHQTAADACKGSNATIGTIARLAAALDTSVADLIAPEDEPHRPARTIQLVG
jgi:transcriptional regulator with XRE-family HTH domain